jgi:hypothetical protein
MVVTAVTVEVWATATTVEVAAVTVDVIVGLVTAMLQALDKTGAWYLANPAGVV